MSRLGAAVVALVSLVGLGMTVSETLAQVVATDVICSRCVDTIDIELQAVATGRLRDGAVTESKLAPGAVTNSRIAIGAVREGRIADGAVTNKKIALGAVREGRLATDSVSTAKLQNGAVTAAKLATSVDDRIPPSGDVLNIAAITMVPRANAAGLPVANGCSIANTSTTTILDGLADENNGMLANGSTNYYANAALPDMATVTAFRLHALDNVNGEELAARLYRRRFTTPATPTTAPELMADAASLNAFASVDLTQFEDTVITSSTIDNTNYYYFVMIDLGCASTSTMEALGVQIAFNR